MATNIVESLVPIAQARRTSNLGVPAGFTDITFDTTDVETDSAEIDHDNVTNTDRITVGTTGLYKVSIQGELVTAATLAEVNIRLRVNDTTTVNGSDFAIKAGTDGNEFFGFHRCVFVNLTANDFLSWQATDNGVSGGTLQSPTLFSVERQVGAVGADGATGADGADGDITWEGTWVSQNYTTNQAVYYATTGQSYVCKLNTVSSEVPTNTTYWDILAQKGDVGPASTSQIVTNTTLVSTTSTTDVLVTGMTITPASGTYLVWFTGERVTTNKNADSYHSIWSAGSQVASSEVYTEENLWKGFACVARVTVNGSQAIEGRHRTTANDVETEACTLAILKT